MFHSFSLSLSKKIEEKFLMASWFFFIIFLFLLLMTMFSFKFSDLLTVAVLTPSFPRPGVRPCDSVSGSLPLPPAVACVLRRACLSEPLAGCWPLCGGVEFSPDEQLIYLQISFIILTLVFKPSEWV